MTGVEARRAEKGGVAVGMGKKENKKRFQKKERDLVTNEIQMIKEFGDFKFSF